MKKVYKDYNNKSCNDGKVIDCYNELDTPLGHRLSVSQSAMMESTMNRSNSSDSCPTVIQKPTNICVVSMCMARTLSLSNLNCNRLIARLFDSFFVSFYQQYFYFIQIIFS